MTEGRSSKAARPAENVATADDAAAERLRVARLELEALHKSFDRLSAAIVAVAPDGRIRSINDLARRLLQAGGEIVVRNDRLTASSASDQARLERLLRAAIGLEPAAGRGRSEIVVGDPRSGRGLTLAVIGAQSDPLDTGATIVLAIRRAGPGWEMNEVAFAARYGLTKAEARLVVDLVHGRTLQQMAAEKGTSYETLRSRLKHVFSKTGVHRQVDLVTLAREFRP